jgi:hypothetical protein
MKMTCSLEFSAFFEPVHHHTHDLHHLFQPRPHPDQRNLGSVEELLAQNLPPPN